MGASLRSPVGIVLAAGGSRRMGFPKPLLLWRGGPLVSAHVSSLAAVCRRVLVVTGAHADRWTAHLPPDAVIVHNPNWASTGPWESLGLALATCAPDDEALVTVVDCPPARPATLHALLTAGPPAVPAHRGRRGHPVYVCVSGTVGHSGPLDLASHHAQLVEVDDVGAVLNLNRPEDLHAAGMEPPTDRSRQR